MKENARIYGAMTINYVRYVAYIVCFAVVSSKPKFIASALHSPPIWVPV